MKSLSLKLAAIIFVILTLSSCGDDGIWVKGKGAIIKENRSVTSFNKVNLEYCADVEIIKGNTLNVEVSDYENIIKYIDIDIHDNTLTISRNGAHWIRNSQAKVFITIPENLEAVYLKGSGTIRILDAFENIHEMDVAGSGEIITNSECTTDNLDATISGSGNISFNGYTSELNALISGSGNMNFDDLDGKNAKVIVTGSGNIDLGNFENLNAKITGSGDISYYGNPYLTKSITGSGSIKSK